MDTKTRKRKIKRKQLPKRKPVRIKPEPQDDFITLEWLRKTGWRQPSKYALGWHKDAYRAFLLEDGSLLCYACYHPTHMEDGYYGRIGWEPMDRKSFYWLEVPTIHSRHDMLYFVALAQERIKQGKPLVGGT
jgi:hypothetical protein